MQTILILIDPTKIENANAELCDKIAARIEEATAGEVENDGFDYIDTDEENSPTLLGIWLQAEDAEKSGAAVVKLIKKEKFDGVDLTAAEVRIAENADEYYDKCVTVYPKPQRASRKKKKSEDG